MSDTESLAKEKGQEKESDRLLDQPPQDRVVFTFRRFGPRGRTSGRASAGAVLAMLCASSVLPLLAVGGFVFAVLEPPSAGVKSVYFIVASIILLASVSPFVSATAFAVWQHPRVGHFHIGVLTCVTVALTCGLLENSRIMDESELSDFCERHGLYRCDLTIDYATAVTLALIAIVIISGVIACWTTYRVYRVSKAARNVRPLID